MGFADHYLRIWLLERTPSEGGQEIFDEGMILEEYEQERKEVAKL